MRKNYLANRGYGKGMQNKISGATPHKLTALLYSESVKCLKDTITCLQQVEQYKEVAEKLRKERDESFGPASQNKAIKRAQLMREANRLIANKGQYLTKVNNIMAHLRKSLRDEEYPELCSDFRKLYAFIEFKSTTCLVKNDQQAAKDALKIAEELLNTWNMIPAKYHHITARSGR